MLMLYSTYSGLVIRRTAVDVTQPVFVSASVVQVANPTVACNIAYTHLMDDVINML